jgi:non-homologous end joining protein Ku
MSARPLASGTISFGLVAIPVRLYAPIDSSKTVRFNQLHAKCGTRLRQQMTCPTCQEVVQRDEIRSFEEIPLGEAESLPAELELAKKLVSQTAKDTFHPRPYRDEIREKLLQLIRQKIDGEEVAAAPVAAPKAKVIDLMEALKASLGTSEESSEKHRSVRKPPKRSKETIAQKRRKAAGSKAVDR